VGVCGGFVDIRFVEGENLGNYHERRGKPGDRGNRGTDETNPDKDHTPQQNGLS
jgi:hypothetical protein